jgi:hypothetical protein
MLPLLPEAPLRLPRTPGSKFKQNTLKSTIKKEKTIKEIIHPISNPAMRPLPPNHLCGNVAGSSSLR